ncbi:MAG: hypothetical protein JXR10_05930 [Cyclobacteriaceae bacterium]
MTTSNYLKGFWTALVLLLTLAHHSSNAQDVTSKVYGGVQLWARYTHQNPGSLQGDKPSEYYFDGSLRRYRLGVKGTVSDQISYNLQVGHNNLNHLNSDKAPKLLDAYVDFKISKNLALIAGKHAWTGLTRYAAPSTFSAMGTDINYHATPFLNVQDDFFRRFGVAAHGKIAKLDYRVVLAKPNSNSTAALSENANFINDPDAVHTSGYFKWEFFDKESLSSAFSPWTYLGKKKILNIGAGFSYQSNSTENITSTGDSVIYDAISFGVDVLHEWQPSERWSMTWYASFIHHDLGPGFIRNIGPNNSATATTANGYFNGKGNAFPTVGSGDLLFLQFAMLRPLKAEKESNVAIQTYVNLEYGSFEALDDPMIVYELGVNYLLKGHKSKISLGMQQRPLFMLENGETRRSEYLGMYVLQYQVRF